MTEAYRPPHADMVESALRKIAPEAPPWEAETYKRLLTLIGGFDRGEEFDRAKTLFREFNHFFPNAKVIWDTYCQSMGVRV